MGGMMQAIFHGGPFDGDKQLVNLGPQGARPTRLILPSNEHLNVFYVYKLWIECGTKLYYRLNETLQFDQEETAESYND